MLFSQAKKQTDSYLSVALPEKPATRVFLKKINRNNLEEVPILLTFDFGFIN